MFNIAYAINEAYADYCLISMISLIYNNKEENIQFHILTDGLSDKCKDKFHSTLKRLTNKGGNIRFYDIPDSKVANLALNGWSKYIWYRLFLPQLLDQDVERVLYLDTDTIVCGKISDLFKLDIEDYSIAGVPDIMNYSNGIFEKVGYPKEYGYICSGVLIINLKYFRKHNLSTRIIEFSIKHHERVNFPDQDAINYVCHDTKIMLPLKYDMLAPFFTDKEFIDTHTEEVKDMLDDPRIIHYAGCNPWIIRKDKHYYHNEFWKYAKKVGDIKPKYCNPLHIRIRITIKGILGMIGIKQFKKYIPKKRPDFSALNTLK